MVNEALRRKLLLEHLVTARALMENVSLPRSESPAWLDRQKDMLVELIGHAERLAMESVDEGSRR